MPEGYRPYDPIIMGFLSPDSDSPFGQGGLNAYAYCAGDPVNRIDPSGHGWVTWLVAGIGKSTASRGRQTAKSILQAKMRISAASLSRERRRLS